MQVLTRPKKVFVQILIRLRAAHMVGCIDMCVNVGRVTCVRLTVWHLKERLPS